MVRTFFAGDFPRPIIEGGGQDFAAPLDFKVDGAEHGTVDAGAEAGFFLRVVAVEVVLLERGEIRLRRGADDEFRLLGHEAEFPLDGADELDTDAGVLAEVGEIDALEGFQQAVPLHDLVVEIRQGERFLLIDDESELEAEPGNLDRAAIQIDAVDGVLNDGAFDHRTVRTGMEGELGPENFLQQADGECPGADGGIADFHLVQ